MREQLQRIGTFHVQIRHVVGLIEENAAVSRQARCSSRQFEYSEGTTG